MKQNSISWWMVGVGTLILAFIGILLPLLPAFLAPLIGLIFVVMAKAKGWMKDFNPLRDLSIMFITFFLFLIIIASLGVYALATISWVSLIIIGVIASVIAWVGDFVPIIGDFISGFVIFLLCVAMFGTIGTLIGALIAVIAFIPFTFALSWLNFLFIPIVLIVFKLLSLLIISAIKGVF